MQKLKADERKEKILDAALRVSAKNNGWSELTSDKIATEANCSKALVFFYFNNIKNLRKVIMKTAVERKNLPIVIQGIMARDRIALKAPFALKAAAIQSLG